jgi:hypothetical protein
MRSEQNLYAENTSRNDFYYYGGYVVVNSGSSFDMEEEE